MTTREREGGKGKDKEQEGGDGMEGTTEKTRRRKRTAGHGRIIDGLGLIDGAEGGVMRRVRTGDSDRQEKGEKEVSTCQRVKVSTGQKKVSTCQRDKKKRKASP